MAESSDGEMINTSGGYGNAGCGLGALVFGKKPGAVQIVASFLNGTGMQTFAMTSGTSNCGKGLMASNVNDFVDVNKVALETELSQGGGETTLALENLMKCKNGTFGQEMKQSYFSSFPNGGASNQEMVSVAQGACKI